MSDPLFLKSLKKKLVGMIVDQLLLELSDRMPVLLAPKISRLLGITPDPASFIASHEFLAMYRIKVDSTTTALDLGCGSCPRNPFAADKCFGVDIREDLESNIMAVDLNREALPFSREKFEYVTAHDLVEHIPRIIVGPEGTRFPFVNLMNEVHRVLIKGGYFFSQTPAYPSLEAFQDPTHVNYITTNTFPMYFCRSDQQGEIPAARMYGFQGEFQLIKQERSSCWLLSLMKKV